jgi:hypothetical protein
MDKFYGDAHGYAELREYERMINDEDPDEHYVELKSPFTGRDMELLESIKKPLLAPRPRRIAGKVLTILGLLVLLAACGTKSEPPSPPSPEDAVGSQPVEESGLIRPEQLVASWLIYDYGYKSHIRFNDDGTFQRSHSFSAKDVTVLDSGNWQLAEDVLTLISDPAIANCGPGTTGRYQLHARPHDGLFFWRVDESCEGRLGFGWQKDYAPIQAKGKMCRLDSVDFCDSFIGYEPIVPEPKTNTPIRVSTTAGAGQHEEEAGNSTLSAPPASNDLAASQAAEANMHLKLLAEQ